MPRTCTVCTHPERESIDRALVEGAAFRNIAERYGTSATALFRHKAEHLPVALVKAQDAADVAAAADLLTQVRDLQARALAILGKAEDAGDLRTALLAISQARSNLELLAKLTGELDDRPQVNVLVAPEWLAVRGALLAALAPYPAARVAVASCLVALDAPAEAIS